MEQRNIVINNLAIRRAVEELKVTRDYAQLCRILEAAFCNNDFDGFELKLRGGAQEQARYQWAKSASLRENWPAWNLNLDLTTSANRSRGSLIIYRLYSDRALQLDINLLTSVFPVVLADALDRTLAAAEEMMPASANGDRFVAAQAG